ncbi:alpha/beta fold hydrolase [Riemerella columbipharyngis]|uniref:alpha/beta fold hydrolase n=1 Tax=Riemerella columbipharyngis TaxID=1071918 RepID=UPI000B869214|nr:alpha/beta hydrolase [Riemerella columbipharyngis]
MIPIVKEITKAGRKKLVNNQYPIETTKERQKYLNYQKRFREIKVPVLIINGKYDTNNPPKYAEKLHKILPHSKFAIIDRAGHFPWVENPAETFRPIKL